MFDQISIPTDGSDAVRPAVEMALSLAETHDATLHALFIVDQPTSVSGTGEGFSGLDNLLDDAKRNNQNFDTIAAEAIARDIETETVVLRGTLLTTQLTDNL